jgi:SET domain-containing protein
MSYKPLPDNLTIKESSIHGLGLFATEDIPTKLNYNMHTMHTHTYYNIYVNEFKIYEELIRTSLGGYINHSNTPNAELYEAKIINNNKITLYKYFLVYLKDIKAGEEILLDYTKELCGLSGYKDEEWLK